MQTVHSQKHRRRSSLISIFRKKEIPDPLRVSNQPCVWESRFTMDGPPVVTRKPSPKVAPTTLAHFPVTFRLVCCYSFQFSSVFHLRSACSQLSPISLSVFSQKETLLSCDLELLHLTLTFKLGLDGVKMKQSGKGPFVRKLSAYKTQPANWLHGHKYAFILFILIILLWNWIKWIDAFSGQLMKEHDHNKRKTRQKSSDIWWK